MISELRMEDSKLYMVDSEGNEHEISPKVDVDVNDYMKWSKPLSYEPYEPVGKNLSSELKIDDSGIILKCEGLRSYGKSFMESYMNTINSGAFNFNCDDTIDAMRYCVEDIKNTKKMEEFLNKKEGENMKILNMYVEKSQENIRKYYDNLIEMEKNNDVVTKEYDELINKFMEDMEKLAEKYNELNTPNGSYLTEDCGDYDFHYMVVHKNTEKEEMYYKLRDEELKQLHDKIDEINAQLEMVDMFGDENNCDYDTVQGILVEYGVINENGRLTPYTPTFADEEAPKKVGRPKKVSE